MKADFSGLEKLQAQIRAMGENKDRIIKETAKELAQMFLAEVMKTTPVDTGHLRRNWRIRNIRQVGNAYTCTIVNPVEYASYVEYGHRTVERKDGTRGWVEGQFMMTLAAQAIQKIGDVYVERKFEEFLRRHWNGK